MGMFGPCNDEVWRRFGEQIGADFVEAGFWKRCKLQAHVGPWTLTLDTYTVSTGHAHITYTRMRAPYVNPKGFRFTAYRNGLFSELGKLLGMQDVQVGDTEFDEAFIVQATDEAKVTELFADPHVRALALAQPQIHLEVKDSEG